MYHVCEFSITLTFLQALNSNYFLRFSSFFRECFFIFIEGVTPKPLNKPTNKEEFSRLWINSNNMKRKMKIKSNRNDKHGMKHSIYGTSPPRVRGERSRPDLKNAIKTNTINRAQNQISITIVCWCLSLAE